MNKWLPFNSLINPDEMISDVTYKKDVIEKPVLSEDQLMEIQQQIIDKYTNKQEISLLYYRSSKLHEIQGIITKIDDIMGQIILNKKINIKFDEIIEILG